MWVFCCGMMRAGSTLQFQLAAQIVEDASLGRRVEWVLPEEFPKLREKYTGYGGMKVFKTHICTKEMAEEFERGNARGIYVYRDLRDVMVSVIRKTGKSFYQFWDDEFLSVCLRSYETWTSLPGVLVSRYEDMIKDLPGEVQRIAAHLGVPIDRAASEDVASAYTLERQIEKIEAFKKGHEAERSEAQGFVFDRSTLLHNNHITSGESMQWREFLTHEQLELIEEKAGGWLLSHGYELAKPMKHSQGSREAICHGEKSPHPHGEKFASGNLAHGVPSSEREYYLWQLRQQAQRIQKLRGWLRALRTEKKRLQGENLSLQQEMAETVGRLRRELNNRDAIIKSLAARIDGYENSFSWRLTRPVRKAGSAIRMLKGKKRS